MYRILCILTAWLSLKRDCVIVNHWTKSETRQKYMYMLTAA